MSNTMDRREFLKISSLFAMAITVTANPVLNAAAKALESKPLNVVFYKVKKISNSKWYLKGTSFIDLPKKTLNTKIYDAKSFTVLQIVDNSEAHALRKTLWKEHGCQKPYIWGTYDLKQKSEAGVKAAAINKASGSYMINCNKMIARRAELIESGEWSKFASKGWEGIKDKEAALKRFASVNEQGRKAAVKVTKAKAVTKNKEMLQTVLSSMIDGRWYTASEITRMHDNFNGKHHHVNTRRFLNRHIDYFNTDYPERQDKYFQKK